MAAVRIAALVAVASFCMLALSPPLWAVIGLAFSAGLGVGPIEPAVFRSVATAGHGAARGRSLASVTAVAYLGYLLSPPILGQVADLAGWPALWVAAAGAAAAAALLARKARI